MTKYEAFASGRFFSVTLEGIGTGVRSKTRWAHGTITYRREPWELPITEDFQVQVAGEFGEAPILLCTGYGPAPEIIPDPVMDPEGHREHLAAETFRRVFKSEKKREEEK